MNSLKTKPGLKIRAFVFLHLREYLLHAPLQAVEFELNCQFFFQ